MKKIYGLFDADGNQVDQGDAKELGKKYYVNYTTISGDAKSHAKLLGQYDVRVVDSVLSDKVREKREAILRCYKKGMTVIQVSVATGINECTVQQYMHNMRDEGVIE